MRVLFITDVFPCFHAPGGSPTRVYCLIRELSKRHQIILLSTRWPGVEINSSSLDGICKKVHFYQFCPKPVVKNNGLFARIVGRKNWERVREMRHLLFEYPQTVQGTLRHFANFREKLLELDLEQFDLVQVEVSNIAYRGAEIKKINPKIPMVLDLHDVDSLIEYRKFRHAIGFRWRIYTYFEWKKMVRYERHVLRIFDRCLTVSEEDRNVLLSIAPSTRASVIPNGVDSEFFKDIISCHWEPFSLVFVGSDWPPNIDAVLFFHKDIFPLIKQRIPNVKFYIVGGIGQNEKVKRLSDENTIVTGFVDDVRRWVKKATVSIVPMRLGGGTKVKILEALSMGKAVVSTPTGCEGIQVTHGKDIFIADRPQDFAHAILRLFSDRNLCISLGENGRELVKKKYDWSVIGQQLEEVYQEVAGERRTLAS